MTQINIQPTGSPPGLNSHVGLYTGNVSCGIGCCLAAILKLVLVSQGTFFSSFFILKHQCFEVHSVLSAGLSHSPQALFVLRDTFLLKCGYDGVKSKRLYYWVYICVLSAAIGNVCYHSMQPPFSVCVQLLRSESSLLHANSNS